MLNVNLQKFGEAQAFPCRIFRRNTVIIIIAQTIYRDMRALLRVCNCACAKKSIFRNLVLFLEQYVNLRSSHSPSRAPVKPAARD